MKQPEMTHDEARMTREFPNDEWLPPGRTRGGFVIRVSSLIRHSSFVIRHSP